MICKQCNQHSYVSFVTKLGIICDRCRAAMKGGKTMSTLTENHPVNACKTSIMSFCNLPASLQSYQTCRFFDNSQRRHECLWYREDYSGACDCTQAQIAAQVEAISS